MSISLAPIRYRHVFSRYGGPIERLETFPQRSSDGRERQGANAFLAASLRPDWVSTPHLYSNADGSGTHSLRNAACYIAISEALERWAFYVASDGESRRKYAFDKDPSTTGMAAFPGLLTGSARRRATLEAAERWSIVEWWLGRAPSRLLHQDDIGGAVEILTPFPRCYVTVVWRRCRSGVLAYGFAAGSSIDASLQHARVEQDRNIVALESMTRPESSDSARTPAHRLTSSLERRLTFFASREGEALFHERRAQSGAMRTTPTLPRVLVDREIPGPWNRYTTVWRVLYEQTADTHLNENRNDFFLF